jgi:hypothetical protein
LAKFYLKNFLNKIRFSHSLRLFFDAVSKLGIRISPYYLFQEVITPGISLTLPAGFADYKVVFLGPECLKTMAAIPGRRFSEKDLLDRLKRGNKSLGLKKDNELVAFTWCDLDEFSFKLERYPLKEDEAYIFDAYTLMEYRGKGIAPLLRYHLYKELEKIGRIKLYSLSDYFNTPAINFKMKLNARKIKLYLYVVVFGKWNFRFLLKDFTNCKNR